MAWTEVDRARRVWKFMKNGVLTPFDLNHNELRLLRKYYPTVYRDVKEYYYHRHVMIEAGEWSEDDEPEDTDRRINRYENGNAVLDPWKPKK